MKTLIAAFVLLASPAFAYFQEGSTSEPDIHYLSWCDGNNVVAENSQGQLIVRAACTERQTCQTFTRYQIDRAIVIGSCIDKK